MEMTYLTQPNKRWTFEQPKLKKWIEEHCRGKTLNLFAGKTKLNVDETRVDSSAEFIPDYCMDACDFVDAAIRHNFMYDTVILDPPYSLRKSMEKYRGKYVSKFRKIKDLLPRIINPRGRVITLLRDTVGMSKSRGFKKIAVCVVCHNGAYHDTLVVVEEKVT